MSERLISLTVAVLIVDLLKIIYVQYIEQAFPGLSHLTSYDLFPCGFVIYFCQTVEPDFFEKLLLSLDLAVDICELPDHRRRVIPIIYVTVLAFTPYIPATFVYKPHIYRMDLSVIMRCF